MQALSFEGFQASKPTESKEGHKQASRQAAEERSRMNSLVLQGLINVVPGRHARNASVTSKNVLHVLSLKSYVRHGPRELCLVVAKVELSDMTGDWQLLCVP